MGRIAHIVLALASAPLFIAFAWQSTIATMSDDSVSYLAMARWFAGAADPFLAPWLGWHSHFPPLFPMVLAATGGASNLLVAHVVVAAFAVVSVALLARYAALRLEDDRAGVWVAAAFLLLPTAWIGVKGILSESLYLAISLAALIVHEKRLAHGEPVARSYLLFGLLLGLAYSTRAIGVTLLAAFMVREAVRAVSARRVTAHAWLALVPIAIFAAAWPLVRPAGHVYAGTIALVAKGWMAAPLASALAMGEYLPGGWLATFAAEGDLPTAMRMAIYAAGVAALAGGARAALRNRIDGWYVLLTVVVLFGWVSDAENLRRLLYPIAPLALLHGAEAVIAGARRAGLARPRLAAAAICAIPLAACLPATALVAQKSLDRTELIPGQRYRASDITDYYRIINRPRALALAAKHAGTLAGLEAIRTATPAGARVMWMRPEYLALLGGREAVPQYYEWDARKLASRIRDERVDYLVVAGISKSDPALRRGDPLAALRDSQPYSQPVFALASPFTGEDEFILLRIDGAALGAYLAGARP